MKRTVMFFMMMLLLGLTASIAQTDEKPYYTSLRIGASFPKDYGDISNTKLEFDAGVNLSAAVGMRLQQTVRLELEGSYRKADANKRVSGSTSTNLDGDVTIKTLMGNIYWDLPVKLQMQPYLVGGVGVGWGNVSVSGENDHRTDLAYQVGGGFSYDLSDKVTADIGYRYFGMQYPVVNIGVHEFLVGLRYGF
ncbi:MAG: porin family protein [Magnetococcales bacterium]|nr:porin family protein [Magnetococcales bacterium]